MGNGSSSFQSATLSRLVFALRCADLFCRSSGRNDSLKQFKTVDEEIKRLLTDAHQKVRSFWSSCRDSLEELAQLLLEKEVVERPGVAESPECQEEERREGSNTTGTKLLGGRANWKVGVTGVLLTIKRKGRNERKLPGK